MKKKKYMVGGKVNNYVQDPSTVLAKLQIDLSKAKQESMDDPLANIFDGLSAIAPMIMGNIGTGSSTPTTQTVATGGKIKRPNIEIERGEIIERPDGTILDFKDVGKKHKSGGIKLDNQTAPVGTEVHSAEVKINGKSMADIKRKYESKLDKITKLLAENPTDKVLANTKNLFEEGYKKVNDRNMMIQDVIKESTQKMATGGTIDDLSEDEMYEVEAYANENDISLEEAYDMLYGNAGYAQEDEFAESEDDMYVEDDEYTIEEEEEEEDNEDIENYFVTGGTNEGPKPKKNRVTGSKLYGKFENPMAVLARFRGIAEDFNMDVNLDDPKSAKAFQKALGMTGKEVDGKIGKNTHKKSLEYLMNNLEKASPPIFNPLLDFSNYEFPNDSIEPDTEKVKAKNTLMEVKTAPYLSEDGYLDMTDYIASKEDESDSSDSPKSILGNFSSGDIVGMLGSLYGSTAGLRNTEANRAGDTPNINPYANFGDEAMKTLDKASKGLEINRDSALNNAQLSRNAAQSRGRNSSRSINMSRAMDLATDQIANKQENDIYANSANMIANLFNTKANAQFKQDEVKMRGNSMKDLNDRRDRDSYYSQKGQDLQSIATGLQQFGKHLNTGVERNMQADLLSSLSEYFGVNITADGITIGNKKKGKKK